MAIMEKNNEGVQISDGDDQQKPLEVFKCIWAALASWMLFRKPSKNLDNEQ